MVISTDSGVLHRVTAQCTRERVRDTNILCFRVCSVLNNSLKWLTAPGWPWISLRINISIYQSIYLSIYEDIMAHTVSVGFKNFRNDFVTLILVQCNCFLFEYTLQCNLFLWEQSWIFSKDCLCSVCVEKIKTLFHSDSMGYSDFLY